MSFKPNPSAHSAQRTGQGEVFSPNSVVSRVITKGNVSPVSFPGFTKVERTSYVLDIAGMEGKGKTHLALTAPKPAICDTERKAYRVLQKGVGNPDRLFCPSTWAEIEAFCLYVADDATVETVIFDTLKEIEEMATIATMDSLGKDSLYSGDSGAVMYRYVNAKLEGLFRTLRIAGKSVITTARMKPEYVNGKENGLMKRDGWNKMPYYADFCIQSIEAIPGVSPSAMKPCTYLWKVTKNGALARGTYAEVVYASDYSSLMTALTTPILDQAEYMSMLKTQISK